MKVEVVYSPAARVVDLSEVDLPEGADVAAALAFSGLLSRHPSLSEPSTRIGIWGRVCELDALVRDGDRVEVYRALQVDPKDARRRRGLTQKGTQKRTQKRKQKSG